MYSSSFDDEGGWWCCRLDSNFRHRVGSFIAGCLFVAGWLIWIDGAVAGNQFSGWREPPWYFYLPGFISTFVLLMMNMVSLNDMHPFSLMFSEDISHKVRAWLFVAFAIGFGAIGASIWMCVDSYQHESGSKMWPGISLILQNAIIFASSVVLLFARKTEEEEMIM
ncbi:uncharacterized protein ACA1_301700 [Acanthamoeba castellanii str. Neff]|uniref:Transmembrane protein n=1 Tax=Acanthamoeba castellanii (strain ATCC 30010 / Neff) TaxID=1257118 RepID=L8HHA6_ACACF|nr:uncharacterized protein ACA1_301700 [Acanthamoeba castellanii str. Neff]ELR24969.1 hypothetical protein ACA1_301700 [Acanthamoeba castellanii str. Neff]